MILYEAPHRLVKTLKLLAEHLGEGRRATVCRELTKRYETAFLTTLGEAVSFYEANEPKGECVLVIAGKSREELDAEEKTRWEELSVQEHMQVYLDQGMEQKEAMKKVAKDRGVSKREIYKVLVKD